MFATQQLSKQPGEVDESVPCMVMFIPIKHSKSTLNLAAYACWTMLPCFNFVAIARCLRSLVYDRRTICALLLRLLWFYVMILDYSQHLKLLASHVLPATYQQWSMQQVHMCSTCACTFTMVWHSSNANEEKERVRKE